MENCNPYKLPWGLQFLSQTKPTIKCVIQVTIELTGYNI